MKNKLKILMLSVALATGPMTALVSCSGCTTTQEATYKTLNIIATSVDAGMNAFADAVEKGKVPSETQAKVRDLHGKYQNALQAAILVARFDMAKPAPSEVQALAAQLLTLITEVAK